MRPDRCAHGTLECRGCDARLAPLRAEIERLTEQNRIGRMVADKAWRQEAEARRLLERAERRPSYDHERGCGYAVIPFRCSCAISEVAAEIRDFLAGEVGK